MRIVLVTPRNPRSFWTYDDILPVLGVRSIFPNLSMPTVAGLTPRGHEVVLVDENVEDLDFEVEADVVGITGYAIHRPRIIDIAARFRGRGRFVAIGGPWASLCPEEARAHCDVLFMGEAEETWGAFLRDLEAGAWKAEYGAEAKPDVTRSPMPRLDLLEMSRYHAVTLQFGRGCPFQCEFCDIIVVYGRRPRTKRVDQMMDEIREAHRLGARQIFIVDDNFIGDKRQAKALLRAMASWGRARGFPVDFNTEVSLNLAQDDELLELMRAANFTTIFIGIESPRKDSLTETRKTQNVRADLVESVHKIQSYGIQIQGGMIVGFDHDDASIFEEQLRFTREARIPVSMTGMLQAAPGTPLYDRVRREGRLLGECAGDQFAFSNIRPLRMSRRQLYEGYRWLLRELYDFGPYRERTLAFLLTRGDQVHGGRNVRRGDVRRLLAVLAETVLRGGWRRAAFTLWLLGATLVRRPSVFKEAVSFALVHRAFHAYVEELTGKLTVAIAELDDPPQSRASRDPHVRSVDLEPCQRGTQYLRLGEEP
jgi:radical SAM superfamily enzyme YgiQ (UPF0313 family)